MTQLKKPIAIYHEHPDWFRPLFEEFDRRHTPYVRIDARRHQYDIAPQKGDYALLFNRMSPSAYIRGNGHGIFYTLSFLAHLEHQGVRVVNGHKAFTVEISKALQLSLLQSVRLPYPRARVINHSSEALAAAEGLRFPVVVKPNIGGSGAGIVRFDRVEDLKGFVSEGRLDLGLDQTALVQEFIPARDRQITRVEVLGGKFLYAIKVFFTSDSYNLCPADICQTTEGLELIRSSCPVDAPKNKMKVEAFTPPREVINSVEHILKLAGIEVGGVEYIIDDRDGELLYYDINALSNFVADGPHVIGFDPYSKLVDYLEQEAA